MIATEPTSSLSFSRSPFGELKKKISVLHVLPTAGRVAGGTAICVRRMVECMERQESDFSYQVFSANAQISADAPRDWQVRDLRLFDSKGPDVWAWSPGMGAALRGTSPDVIHVHGLWTYHTFAALRTVRHQSARLVVSPHGMLEPWALQHRPLRKRVAGWLYHNAYLRHAACVVATSQLEADGLRLAGVTRPVVIVRNGVDIAPEGELAFGRGRAPGGPRRVLFLSRLEPKKGLLDLVAAWRELRPAGWKLTITGPDIDNYQHVVACAVREAGLEDAVEFTGPAWNGAKSQAYAAADVFVLPSYSENFGIVIGEALAAGVPVITTRATPWDELVTHDCGWWTETGVPPLVAALREAIGSSPERLAAMGRRGRALVIRRYGWDAVCRDIAFVHRWVCGDPVTAGLVTTYRKKN